MNKIDLSRFSRETEALVAIVDGWGRANGRSIKLDVNDGWYFVSLADVVKLKRKATAMDLLMRIKSSLRAYAFGDEGVPINFTNFFERGLSETVKIHFLNAQPFEVVKIATDETGRWYHYDIDMRTNRQLLSQLRISFKEETSIDKLKGLTPELRYYFLLLSLQRQSYREYEALQKLKLSEAEKEKRIKEFQATFAGRLKTTVENAGGELLRFYKANKDTYVVEWKIKGSRQTVKSTIHDDLQILSLGFCASGHDKEHSMSSAIQLAKMYGDLYITRE